MSFLKSKHSGWTWDMKRTPFTGGGGSGGGSPGPTQSTSYSTNIPEYARPYVENMLQAAQTQVYNDDMTSFRGYTPYSTDVNNYFAGFSPLQQSAQQSAWNMQTPGQYGLATGLAGQAGVGALNTQQNANMLGTEALGYGQAGSMYGGQGAQQAMQTARMTGAQAAGYGGMGSMYGQQAADMAQQGYGAGAQFAQQATDPNAVRAYMSPYMQNVVDYQKGQAARDFGMAQTARQAKAVGAGAFGGSRQAIENAEAQRTLMSQLQGIEATGAQDAFKNAQAQQQFGAQLGLQGLQAGYQGTGMGIQGAQTGLQGVGQQLAAGNLGLQGTAQGIQGAQAGLQGVQGALGAGNYGLAGYGMANQAAGTLGQLGTQDLAAQQSIINLQNTLGGQQQALEQNKINQAIQDYAIQQQYPMMQLGFLSNMIRGLPMQSQTTQLYQAQPTALQQGIGLLGAGASLYGAGKAEGGIVGYKYGGAIPSQKLEGMAEKLDPEQLQARLKDPQLDKGERRIFEDALEDKAKEKARYAGLGAAGGGLFNTMGYAGGGILAFDDGGEVEHFQAGGSPRNEEERSAFMQDLIDTFGYSGASDSSPEVPSYLKRAGEYFTKPRAKPTPTIDSTPSQEEINAIRATNKDLPVAGPTQAERDAFYANGVKGSQGSTGAQPSGQSNLGGILAGLRKEGPQGELGADYIKTLEENLAGADKRMSRADKIAMAKGFLKFGSTPAPGGIGQAAVAGLGEYTEGYAKAIESDEKYRAELNKQKQDVLALQRAEERGDVKLASEIQDRMADRANRLQTAQISAAASGRAGAREDAYVKQLMAQGMTLEQALQAVKGAGRAESNDIARMKAADAALASNVGYMRLSNSKDSADQQKAAQIRNEVYGQYGISPGGIGGSQTTGGSGNLVQNKDGSFNYVPK